MRVTDENTAQALTGSRPSDLLVCWVWYDGALAMDEPLPVSSWSLGWDGDERQKVPGKLSLSVKDADGELGPWLYSDPLGVGGARVQVFYRVGGAGELRMGWYRITTNQVEESWVYKSIREDGYYELDSAQGPGVREIAVTLGSSVDVGAVDLLFDLDGDDFLAPEQPAGAAPTVMSEVVRIVGDTFPVTWTGVVDRPVPKGVTWENSRVEAVMDLLAMAGASMRMGPDGELECYVKTGEPVFALAGGDDGVLINLSRGQSLADVYNIGSVSSTRKGKDATGQDIDIPIVGTYEISSGDLRAGGPMGRRVIRNDNPLMDSQAKCDAAARTLVLNRLAALSVDLDVYCLPDPRIQTGDFGTVVAPVIDGRRVPLVGEVVSVSLSGDGATVGQMQLKVRCLLTDVAAALKGFTIANALSPNPPEFAGTLTPAPGRVVFGQDKQYSAFPGACLLADGSVLAVWREGADHVNARDGVIRSSISADNGGTWSAAVTMLAMAGTDLRDPSVSLSSDRLVVYLTYFKGSAANPAEGFFVRQSTDGGLTFGAESRIDPGHPFAAGCAPLITLPNGDLLATWYGKSSMAQTRNSVWTSTSTSGAVWTAPVKLVDGVPAAADMEEPWAAIRGGHVVIMYRHGNVDRIGLVRSTNGGASWSEPAPVFVGTGRPGCMFTTSGILAVVYRERGTGHGLLRTTLTYGDTWTEPQLVEAAAPQWWNYSAMVEAVRGDVLCISAVEHNPTSSTMSTRHLIEGVS